MSDSTSIEMEIELSASSEQVFDALVSPSAIRQWWSADRAIVVPQVDGWWMAAWGEVEDDPDFVCGYRLAVFDRPHKIVFADPVYISRTSFPESMGSVTVEFLVESIPSGARLSVSQSGLPASEEEFCKACVVGWQTTLAQLKDYCCR